MLLSWAVSMDGLPNFNAHGFLPYLGGLVSLLTDRLSDNDVVFFPAHLKG